MIGYLNKVIRSLVLILPKMSACVYRFKVKDVDKDKNNKMMSFSIDDNLLEKYRIICSKIKDLIYININHI